MLVVDLLHEFELGVWKSLFTHLIRLLYAAGKGSDRLVTELDARFAVTYLPYPIAIDIVPVDIAKSQHSAREQFESFLKTHRK